MLTHISRYHGNLETEIYINPADEYLLEERRGLCGAYPTENSSMMYPDSDDFELIRVHYSERFDWCRICQDIYYYDSYLVQLTDEEITYILELRNSLTAAANAHRDGREIKMSRSCEYRDVCSCSKIGAICEMMLDEEGSGEAEDGNYGAGVASGGGCIDGDGCGDWDGGDEIL